MVEPKTLRRMFLHDRIMNSRERMARAIRFQQPDRIPIMHSYSKAGYAEHGEKLRELWKKYPGDSRDPTSDPVPYPDPAFIDKDGKYSHIWTDSWGVTWEERLWGIWPMRIYHPLDDLTNLKNYEAPPLPSDSGEEFEKGLRAARLHKERYYLQMGTISIWDGGVDRGGLQSLRRLERVLIDIERDTAEINYIADMLTDYQLGIVKHLLKFDPDGISFADDYGTQHNLMLSLKTWRRFFKPRYERLMEPIKKAGKDIIFHSCGHILPLIDDFGELGINAIWPQLGVNDNEKLAEKLLQHHICLYGHLDRQRLMAHQPPPSPQEVDAAVKRMAQLFGHREGGLIFFAEIDIGFTFENIKAALDAFWKYGKMK